MGGMHDRVVEVTIPQRPKLYDRYYTIRLPRLPGRPSWPWMKLLWTHALAIAAGLLLAALIFSLGRWDGSALDNHVSGQWFSTTPGGSVTFSVPVTNMSDAAVVVEKVGLAQATSWARLIGVSPERPTIAPHAQVVFRVRVRAHQTELAPGGSEGIDVGRLRLWYRSGFDLPLLGRGHWVQTAGENLQLRVTNP